MKLSQYGYDFSADMIAKYPTTNRDDARLMVLHRSTGEIEHRLFKDIIESVDQALAPAWLSVDAEKQTIKVERLPEREEIDLEFKEQLIIEFYSK